MGDAAAPAVGRAPDLVGRDSERARIDAFLEDAIGASRSLVIRGEPGIGKTALWRDALDRSRRAGFLVLVARPAEEERSIALAGLVDLFDGTELDAAALQTEEDPLSRGRTVLEALRAGWSRPARRWSRSTTCSGSTRRLRALSATPFVDWTASRLRC